MLPPALPPASPPASSPALSPGTAPAPPLAQVLTVGARAWLQLRTGQSLERAAAAALATEPVGGRLGGAVRDLLYTCARRRALIDALVGRLANRRPEASLEALIGAALALLLARAYADHVVVDQAVDAARAAPAWRNASGFVNATLRGFLRERAPLIEDCERSDTVRFNLPAWWLERTQQRFAAEWRDIADSQLGAPPLVLRVNRRRTSVAAYLEQLAAAGIAASVLGPSAVWIHQPRPVGQIPGFDEGRVSVQDAAAQLAAPWVGAGAGMRVLDACAAPGGKTAHLRELADVEVDAVEIDPARAARIAPDLDRLGLAGGGERPAVRVLVADAADPAAFRDRRPYDRILLDAPCTGSGVVRRHPDIPWLRRNNDVANLATRQSALLDALWPLLAPAGRLLYVVCSVFAEEGPIQAAAFAGRHADARPALLAGCEQATLQLLPRARLVKMAPKDGPGPEPDLGDGFFFALFEKAG
jgi:16S rRNA (cytosine967-C5)-methyltransferase